MKYFTWQRYLALQARDDAAVHAADADWEQAAQQYDESVDQIRAGLSESFRQLLDGFFLHDARVLSMGRRGELFTISLQLDAPPQELLTINYTLAGEPDVRRELFPHVSDPSQPLWLYEELGRPAPDQPLVHSILLSNGWELDLPCREVHLATAYPMIPTPRVPPGRNVRLPVSTEA